ncbi:MAG TPA: NUDIX hydrolase [Nannocystis sp.]|jgi:ADP-ribose pyrophosphatase
MEELDERNERDAQDAGAAEPTTIASGRFLRLVRRGTWEFVERVGASGAVCIIAVTDDRKLVLIEQPRPAMNGYVIELPAGLVGDGEDAGELGSAAANRELVEETGFEAAHIEEVATGPVTPGLSNECVALFLATGLRRVGPGGGVDGEQITVHEVPLLEVEAFLREQAARGRTIDLKVYSALHFARRVV